MQEFLQGTAVDQAAAYLGHQGLGNVKGEAAPGQATLEDVAEVLFPGKAGGAVLAHTGAAPQAQGAEGGRTRGCQLAVATNVGRRQGIRLGPTCHTYMSRKNFL